MPFAATETTDSTLDLVTPLGAVICVTVAGRRRTSELLSRAESCFFAATTPVSIGLR